MLHDPWLWLGVATVAALWATAAAVIRRWGPGRIRLSVFCPETGARAEVVILQKEATWGTLQAADVTACSIFAGRPITCQKKCLARL